MTRIGVISDTHGLLRPEAVARLKGAEMIIHAGDIGSPDVIGALESLCPVHAIRGNVDRDSWAQAFPETLDVDIDGQHIYVIHNLKELDFDPAAAGYRVVISGHSHSPKTCRENGVLYLNPGSAGPRRFRLSVAVASLRLSANRVSAEIQTLTI